MKKKFQVNALRIAADNTGKISKVMASSETVTNKINATTLYSIKDESAKQIKETIPTSNKLKRHCLDLLILLIKSSGIMVQYQDKSNTKNINEL